MGKIQGRCRILGVYAVDVTNSVNMVFSQTPYGVFSLLGNGIAKQTSS